MGKGVCADGALHQSMARARPATGYVQGDKREERRRPESSKAMHPTETQRTYLLQQARVLRGARRRAVHHDAFGPLPWLQRPRGWRLPLAPAAKVTAANGQGGGCYQPPPSSESRPAAPPDPRRGHGALYRWMKGSRDVRMGSVEARESTKQSRSQEIRSLLGGFGDDPPA